MMFNCMCLLAALCFVIGNAITIACYVQEFKRRHFDYDQYVELFPSYIQTEWDFRIEHRSKTMSAGIFNTLAWFFLMFPVVQLAWILSHGGTHSVSLHSAIGVLVLAGSLTEWISHVLYIGASYASSLLVNEFNLNDWITTNSRDGVGWRTLEITHIVTYCGISIIGAIEWIFLSIVLVLIHVSVKSWRRNVDTATFGACWNALTLFLALMCILEFVTEVLRLNGFRSFSQVAFWYSAANRLVLFPFWLVVLGKRLPIAAYKLNRPGGAVGEAEAAAEYEVEPFEQEKSAEEEEVAKPVQNTMSEQ